MAHRFILEKYNGRNRYRCPECGHNKELSRYINSETGEHLAENVGRCNRESSCGYHLTPAEYFKSQGNFEKSFIEHRSKPNSEPLPITYISQDLFEASFNGYKNTHFAKWLISLFGEKIASEKLIEYFVGRAKADNAKSTLFWRVDVNDNIRTGKVVCYNPVTGKRKKADTDPKPYFIHSKLEGHFVQCFFGEHLLAAYPDRPVGILESEKSAVVASVYMPNMIFLATGGASGCKWKEYETYKVLKDRRCIFFPDFGYFNRKTQKTCFQEWSERVERIADVLPGSFKVSRVLEDKFKEEDRLRDIDLIDVLLKTDESGLAMTDLNYPVMWDLPK